MVKHLVDVDERSKRISRALDNLAKAHFEGHDGWR